MAYIKEYWNKKEVRAEAAKQHTAEMDREYWAETNISADCTTIYREDFFEAHGPVIEVVDMDSVSAVFHYKPGAGQMAVLNFSSYKNPGGMFINGSSAQEESLCHESNLYNVLVKFQEPFYDENKKEKNKALYMNRALYSPNIMFKRGDDKVFCDVITCAAPNKSAAQQYCGVSDAENTKALKERVYAVLSVAAHQRVDTLILGGYGCGVFGQDPYEVANTFKAYLKYFRFSFKKVVFAIPDHKNGNLRAFQKVFGK